MKLRSIVQLLRPQEYVPLSVALVVLVSYIAAGAFALSAIPIILFAIFSNAFGFVINDAADCELDKLNKKTRNPLALGDLSERQVWAVGGVFLILSLLILAYQPYQNLIAGMGVLLVLFTYSFLIRAKSRPYLDVIYHGLWPALFAFMAYAFYRPIDFLGASIIVVVFLASASAELLQEIRDYESDRKTIRTTVVVIGKMNALYAVMAVILISTSLYAFLALSGKIPFEMLILTPLVVILLHPVAAARTEKKQKQLIYMMAKRAFVICIAILALYFVLGLI